MLTWLQFGDLHASDADNWASLEVFSRLIDDANRYLLDTVDFAVLPGDNANHATPEQFRRIAEAARRLQLPLHILPGDHDFEAGSLTDFYGILGARQLACAVDYRGTPCLFLDLVSAGSGGPDFRLDDRHRRWLTQELDAARSQSHRPVVFMHAYPTDLKAGADDIAKLYSRSHVAFVGTGHTHYNELVNHRHVIYAATRSTGEVEEGPPGFSLGVLDGSVVSWHFRSIDAAWPLVLITSPADRRLVTDPSAPDQVPSGALRVRAKVFGDAATQVTASVDGGTPVAMTHEGAKVWSGVISEVDDGTRLLRVEAATAAGDVSHDAIEVSVGRGAPIDIASDHFQSGFEPVGYWPERSILGTQLGPNKNGRKW